MRGVAGAILGLILSTGIAQAAVRTAAPPSPPLDTLGAPAVKALFARDLNLGQSKYKLDDLLIAELPRMTGVGHMDLMPGVAWVCYDLSDGQRVWFSSGGKASFGFLDNVTLTRAAGSAGRCPALPAKFSPIAIDGTIRLGMTKADLIGRLGTPSRQIDTWVVYSGRSEKGRTGLAVQFANDKAIFISASNVHDR